MYLLFIHFFNKNLDGNKIHGLKDSYFDWKRVNTKNNKLFKQDFTDIQWRNFRQNLPIIFIFALIFLILSGIFKRYFRSYLKSYYLIIGLGYGFYLHGVKISILIIILLINFYFTKLYNLVGKKIFTILT